MPCRADGAPPVPPPQPERRPRPAALGPRAPGRRPPGQPQAARAAARRPGAPPAVPADAPPTVPADAPPERQAALAPRSSLYLQGLRLLSRVRMVGPGVDLQLAELLPGEAVSREHALHRQPDDLLRPALEHVAERARPKPARVSRMAVVALLLALVARDGDLLRVHHDHEVTHVAVRGVLGLPLAPERVGELGGETPDRKS